ncbi:hypothetical protein CAPTEDRAFT_228130 [Capitella teleta]|uniref:Peroxisomal leader peptide-processing protease n=1 Tax=Capitella teleta TaxID=283909 RepID=R7UF29_CAPTE|nr:hypothetical protein CAPTEDRAFT_228130 [Capitella teleta]|eukprot:ELU05129.1 hypothetical protein CAPTEDRAFT_228130 [Capitella teleta]
MSASVTQGVISRVVNHDDTVLLVQSSCAVHAGASGGVLFNSEDQMIGIVTCNARDTGTGASFPHINLCVPFCSIWNILQDYVTTMDEEVLKRFHVKNSFVKKLWLMQAVPSISSKL